MQHKIQLTPQYFYRLAEQVFNVLHTGGIGGVDLRIAFFGQLVNFSHPHGYRRVGQCKYRPLIFSPLSYLPGNRIFIYRSGDYSSFPFK
ncbi:hypothetical protein D9M69_721120 [compost metagenome]